MSLSLSGCPDGSKIKIPLSKLRSPRMFPKAIDGVDDCLQVPCLEGPFVRQARSVQRDRFLTGEIGVGSDHHEEPAVHMVDMGVDTGKQMIPPDLLAWVAAEDGSAFGSEAGHDVSDRVVSRLVTATLASEILVVFDFDADEGGRATSVPGPQIHIEGGTIIGVSRIRPAWGVLKFDCGNLCHGISCHARDEFGCQIKVESQVGEQIECERLAAQQVFIQARSAKQLASGANRVIDFTPDDGADLVIEEVDPRLLCPRHLEIVPNVSATMGSDGITVSFPPKRLQHAGSSLEWMFVDFLQGIQPASKVIEAHMVSVGGR